MTIQAFTGGILAAFYKNGYVQVLHGPHPSHIAWQFFNLATSGHQVKWPKHMKS